MLRLTAQRTQQETGVSAAQIYVLEQLRDGKPLSLNDLARLTMTDRTSVAEVVARLQERKLVHRVADPDDRRRAAITLTPGGRDLLRRMPSTPGAPLIDAVESLSASDLVRLDAGLTRLAHALGADAGPAQFVFSDDAASPTPPRRQSVSTGRGRQRKR